MIKKKKYTAVTRERSLVAVNNMICVHDMYTYTSRQEKYIWMKTRPRPTGRQYLHVTPRLCSHKNMTLIFIGLQNTIYYLIKCTVRTKDGSNCVLGIYTLL